MIPDLARPLPTLPAMFILGCLTQDKDIVTQPGTSSRACGTIKVIDEKWEMVQQPT